ncbi:MAG TPA: DUF222 domain-containing protein [Acidimicrobiales bacterium]|nr:DUF222 domain-containing protein [Acidimicrobiales bacterium]
MYFEDLADAVENLDVPGTCAAVAELLPLLGRLEAKLSAAVDELNHSGEWELDNATSMVSWLRYVGRMSGGAAKAMTTTAARVAALPVTAAAWESGELSSGQVRVIVNKVDERRAELFAEHETELVPYLVPLTVAQTAIAMAEWRRKADAIVDDAAPAEPQRALALSAVGDVHVLSGSFGPDAGEVIAAALRLATTRDSESEIRTAAERRADALVDLCRFFLDNQSTRTGRRHRPHLNLVADLGDTATGSYIDGTIAASSVIESLLCDCNLHRVLVKGRAAILDYGRSVRTAPPDLFNAISLRDGHCREPGCDRPPDWCDAHHVDVWEEGGVTSLDNTVLRCTRHHHQWHRRRKLGWTERLECDGTLVITDPDGRRHLSYPDGPLARRQLWAS